MSLIGIALVYILLVGGVLALVVWGVGSVLGTVSDALGDAARERARLAGEATARELRRPHGPESRAAGVLNRDDSAGDDLGHL